MFTRFSRLGKLIKKKKSSSRLYWPVYPFKAGKKMAHLDSVSWGPSHAALL